MPETSHKLPHPFDIEITTIYDDEANWRHTYTEKQFELAEKMVYFVERHIANHDVPFVTSEDNWDYFHKKSLLHGEAYSKRLREKTIYHGDYFIRNTAAYSYSTRSLRVLDQEDEYFPLFFTFKLRLIKLIELDHFLNYWDKTFKNGFTRFCTLLLRQYACLIDSDKHQSILEWIEDVSKTEKKEQMKTAESDTPKSQTIVESKDLEALLPSDIQMALFFHYFQEHFDFQPEENKQKQDFIKFLHALKGKPFRKIQNSHINRLLRTTPSIGKPENTIKHLTNLQNTFLEYGLTQMSNLVQADILKEKNAKTEK